MEPQRSEIELPKPVVVDTFDAENDIIDGNPPVGAIITASYKKSFAYHTFRIRVPNMIRDIINTMQRYKDELICLYGKGAKYDIQRVTVLLNHLLDNILNNKEFEIFYSKEPDVECWNESLKKLYESNRNWFTACWLYAETYLYRRISSYFKRTETLNNYDYFCKTKQAALFQNYAAILSVARSTRKLPRNEQTFRKLLRLELWGNRCDLSIRKDGYDENAFEELTETTGKLLVDQSDSIWECLITANQGKSGIIFVDIICDNAGFEFFTDLIMAEYLIDHDLATRVRLHVKAIPWYVSDVISDDFYWTLRFLRQDKEPVLRRLGRKLTKYLKEQKIVLMPAEYFWTNSYHYSYMRQLCPCLYVLLSAGILSIFKGDYNYRKLVNDVHWETTTPFMKCLKSFYPTNVVALRAIKSEILCGMPCCVVQALTIGNPNWMFTGEYAVIHFFKKGTERL